MNEIRKIIGVFDNLVVKKEGIAFPTVRAWLRGPNDYVTRDLKSAFPTRGEVFLHISTCDNQHPERHQVGLFNCIRSKPGATAEWEVRSASRSLTRVIDYSAWGQDQRQLSFWKWLHDHVEKKSCSILLGDDTVYVRRGGAELVGPFSLVAGKLISREPPFLVQGTEVANVDVGGDRCSFIDRELLAKGRPLILDPREAILRQLKSRYRSGQFDWLSRHRVQELATALVDVGNAEGSEWVTEELRGALEIMSKSGAFEEKLAEALLEVGAVKSALEGVWRGKHADVVEKSNQEIRQQEQHLTQLKSDEARVADELLKLQAQKGREEAALVDLNKQIAAGKSQAQQAFEEELKRLAQSPASLALIGAWNSVGSKGDRVQVAIREQLRDNDVPTIDTLREALLNNLKSCGLSPNSSTEVASVCIATLAAGQFLSFKSVAADLLADAVGRSLGHTRTLWVDVPAGLIDPVDWDVHLQPAQKGCPIILQGANRSAWSILLGSMRLPLIRQALLFEKASSVVIFTLETRPDMRVDEEVPYGPIVEDRLVKFLNSKVTTRGCSCEDYVQKLPAIEPLSSEDFVTEVGGEIVGLGLLSTSSVELIYRKSYAALRTIVGNASDSSRLFFKFWCLPRLSPPEIRRILEVHKNDWKQDQSLMNLKQAFTAENE